MKSQNKWRAGDYFTFCDICRRRFYASEMSVLGIYTGKGGALVCPDHRFKVHAGFIPYSAPPEPVVPVSRTAWNSDDQTRIVDSTPPWDGKEIVYGKI